MKITIEDIRAKDPCYDPAKYLSGDWSGTLVDILNIEKCPHKYRLWVVTSFLDDKTNRLFAVWCAREALKLIDSPDLRSVEACNVAERFANGEANSNELAAASAAANAAASAAANAAARYAARAANWSAAKSAANAAARYAARAADWSATRAAQIEKLKEMIERLEAK